jgi:hypothetical protein
MISALICGGGEFGWYSSVVAVVYGYSLRGAGW